MGDRANIVIETNPEQNPPEYVWLYTHWGGSELPADVQKALQRKQRWSDNYYLTRIVFCTICPADEHNHETGFGISTRMGDNEHLIILLQPKHQKISFHREKHARTNDFSHPVSTYTFEEFCELPDVGWEALFPE